MNQTLELLVFQLNHLTLFQIIVSMLIVGILTTIPAMAIIAIKETNDGKPTKRFLPKVLGLQILFAIIILTVGLTNQYFSTRQKLAVVNNPNFQISTVVKDKAGNLTAKVFIPAIVESQEQMILGKITTVSTIINPGTQETLNNTDILFLSKSNLTIAKLAKN